VHAARLRLILWTIVNHPDIRLAARHDPRALLINPDDSNDYAQVRKAWIDQVARHSVNAHAEDAQVLANAAQCLGLTDRELAANWIKQAMRIDPRNFSLVLELGDVYAGAISGESGMNPWEGPTSVDAAETQIGFCKAGDGGGGQGIRNCRTHGLGAAPDFQKLWARRKSKRRITIRWPRSC
jgi:hypothetical protein